MCPVRDPNDPFRMTEGRRSDSPDHRPPETGLGALTHPEQGFSAPGFIFFISSGEHGFIASIGATVI